ncbi:MAG: hypothetical protein WBO10_11735 [Pyrinomonadaceae bacterium]
MQVAAKTLFLVCLFILISFAAANLSAQGLSINNAVKSKQLDFMVGDWKVDAKIRTSPTAFITGSGTMAVHFDKENLLAKMKIKFENFEVNGTTKRIFDKAKDRWDVSWLPDGQPPTLNIDGKMLNGRFIEIDYGCDQRGAFIGRLVIYEISNDHFLVRKDQLYDDGAIMKDIWLYEATRVKSKGGNQ